MKRVITLICVVLLVASFGYTTSTRVKGLGIEPWMIEEDDSLILWTNIGYLSRFPNMIWGELGEAVAVNPWGGLSYGIELSGYPSVLGVFIGRPNPDFIAPLLNMFINDVPSIGGVPVGVAVTGAPKVSMSVLNPNDYFDAGYGVVLAENIRLGLGVTLANNMKKVDYEAKGVAVPGTVKEDRASSEMYLTVGGIVSDLGPVSQVDASLAYGLPSVKNTVKEVIVARPEQEWELKTDGASIIWANLRAILGLTENLKAIAYASYGTVNLSNKSKVRVDGNDDGDYGDAGVDTSDDIDRTQKFAAIEVGGAFNLKINEKTLAIASIYCSQTELTNEGVIKDFGTIVENDDVKTTGMKLPVVVAIERKISKLITARLGVSYPLISTEKGKTIDRDIFVGGVPLVTRVDESTRDIRDIPPAQPTISIGMGLKITDALTLDAVIRQQVLFTGTYLISGISESLATQITATYKF